MVRAGGFEPPFSSFQGRQVTGLPYTLLNVIVLASWYPTGAQWPLSPASTRRYRSPDRLVAAPGTAPGFPGL